MKSLLLFAIALITTTTLSAQNFQIGVYAGICSNTSPVITPIPTFEAVTGSRNSTAFSLKAMYSCHQWEYGISADYRHLSYQSTAYVPAPTPGMYQLDGPQNPRTQVTIAGPAIPLRSFVNRVFKFGRFHPYVGVAAGYVFVTPVLKVGENAPATSLVALSHKGDGVSAGVQLGGTYFITRHLGFNVDFNGDYTVLNIGVRNYRLFAFPATAGIRYKF